MSDAGIASSMVDVRSAEAPPPLGGVSNSAAAFPPAIWRRRMRAPAAAEAPERHPVTYAFDKSDLFAHVMRPLCRLRPPFITAGVSLASRPSAVGPRWLKIVCQGSRCSTNKPHAVPTSNCRLPLRPRRRLGRIWWKARPEAGCGRRWPCRTSSCAIAGRSSVRSG